jgi:hypothetical protein
MVKKRKYIAYHNDSDSEVDIGMSQSRMVSLTSDRRRLTITTCSPKKIGKMTTEQPMNQWETNLDLSLGDIGDEYYVDDDSFVHSDSIVQTPAKRYPSSVSYIMYSGVYRNSPFNAGRAITRMDRL